MGFFDFLFGKKETVSESALGTPVDPAALPANGAYPNSYFIGESFTIAPKATEVGIKRAKLYKNRTVVCGVINAGAFNKDDDVIVYINGAPVSAHVLDLIPVDASDFQTELAANMHKKTASQGASAWMILDLTVLPAINTTIGKL